MLCDCDCRERRHIPSRSSTISACPLSDALRNARPPQRRGLHQQVPPRLPRRPRPTQSPSPSTTTSATTTPTSPATPFPRHPAHPAPDDQQDQYPPFHHLHGAEPLFPVHQGLYSSQAQHIPHEYPAEYMHHPHHPPGQQQPHAAGAAKLNGFTVAPNYRNSFTSYPNTTRTRLQVNQSVLAASSSYREQGTTFYPSQDSFSGQITSPVMQQYGSYDYQQQSHQQHLHQQPQQPHQQQPLPVVNGVHKSPYLIDPYPASSKSTTQQQQQAAPGQGQSYAFPNGIGVQLSSQTPYGPHVPAGVSIGIPPPSNANNVNNSTNIPPGLSTSVSIGMANGNGPTTTANGEEISTIFVVGFPEDMQVCTFLPVFLFCAF